MASLKLVGIYKKYAGGFTAVGLYEAGMGILEYSPKATANALKNPFIFPPIIP